MASELERKAGLVLDLENAIRQLREKLSTESLRVSDLEAALLSVRNFEKFIFSLLKYAVGQTGKYKHGACCH